MIDKETFLKGISYLKANYLNWAFDLNNDLTLKVWYKKFANLEPSTFMSLIEKYTEVSTFPPNSPADLLELLRDRMKQDELSPEQAWQEVLRLMTVHGLAYEWDRKELYGELSGLPALYKTVREYESELRTSLVTDSRLKERFMRSYQINLNRHIESKSGLLLGTKPIYMLE